MDPTKITASIYWYRGFFYPVCSLVLSEPTNSITKFCDSGATILGIRKMKKKVQYRYVSPYTLEKFFKCKRLDFSPFLRY